MKHPPRPRRQPRQSTSSEPSARTELGADTESNTRSGDSRVAGRESATAAGSASLDVGDSTVFSVPIASEHAESVRERARRERYAGRGAQMAREARERKVRGHGASDPQMPQPRRKEEDPRAGEIERVEPRRSRTSEQGEAIRRMRAPIGADDAADILGPRDEAPAEARVERIEERLRARRRLTTVQMMSILGALACTALMVWVVFFSALFALNPERIEIAGDDPTVPIDSVYARVAPFAGTPLTRLNVTQVVESIKVVPQIKDAEVHKAWPNGLSVSFVVRKPAMVMQVNGSLVALDDEGIELGPVAQRPAGVPLVALPDDPDNRGAHARGVIAAWTALSEDIRQRVGTVTVANHQMTMALQDGRQVRWGTLTDETLKAKVLQVLMQRDAKIYDVSSPTSPVTSG